MIARRFTTSWDDGHPLDLRLADLLARHDSKGTFYVPSPHCGMPVMSPADIRRLSSLGMEVGAHTISHSVLTRVDSKRVRDELAGGKKWLEDILGAPVDAFCFPEGKFNRRICGIVKECGYRLARTTVAFHTGLQFQPFAMPVSFQFLRHPPSIHVRHGIREGNASGLLHWASRWRFESDLERLLGSMIEHVSTQGGVIHLWGHSWELDRYNLWRTLDRCLKMLTTDPLFRPATNSELLNGVKCFIG